MESAYAGLVRCLGDSRASIVKRETARSMLLKGDKDVIPVLIASLRDARVFDPEYKSPSASAASKVRICTVGEACEGILYLVISGGRPNQYDVSDWQRWWQQNKDKKLHEIIRMVQAEGGEEK